MVHYFPPILRAFIWGLLLTVLLRHLVAPANPFITLVFHSLALVAVLGQLILLRQRGWRYLAIFLGSLLLFISLLGVLDRLLINTPRRYYSIG